MSTEQTTSNHLRAGRLQDCRSLSRRATESQIGHSVVSVSLTHDIVVVQQMFEYRAFKYNSPEVQRTERCHGRTLQLTRPPLALIDLLITITFRWNNYLSPTGHHINKAYSTAEHTPPVLGRALAQCTVQGDVCSAVSYRPAYRPTSIHSLLSVTWPVSDSVSARGNGPCSTQPSPRLYFTIERCEFGYYIAVFYLCR